MFTGIGLRHVKLIKIHSELGGVLRVKRMFGIDKGAGAADFLHLGNDVQRKRRLTGTFRPVDFNHTAAGKSAHAERDIKAQRARTHHINVFDLFSAGHTHDGALAELLFNEGDGGGQRLLAFFLVADALNLRQFLVLFLVSSHDATLFSENI